jgi:hypothetical protein
MTISYNGLGSNGRIGNQMFQYASLRGIAKNRGFDFLIPPENNLGRTNYCLFECFKMAGVKESNKGFSDFTEQHDDQGHFNFSKELFETCKDNINLNGYYQTEKYFLNAKEEVRKDFEFKDEIVDECKSFIDSIGQTPIFLHVRRGDYVRVQQWHPLMPIEYYKNALSKFDKNVPVVILSDDFEWCQQQEIFKPDRFFISESDVKFNNKMQMGDGKMEQSLVGFWDMCLMSLCDGAIIANSTFSWWGAWLQKNPNKKIITPNPKNWFGPMYSHWNMDDIIPETWKVLV